MFRLEISHLINLISASITNYGSQKAWICKALPQDCIKIYFALIIQIFGYSLSFHYANYCNFQIKKKIDVSTGSLPLIIEIYGGPGSTKVTASWKRSWTQTYMCSHHNGKFRFLYISNSNFDSKQSWILQKFLYNLNLCRNLPKL